MSPGAHPQSAPARIQGPVTSNMPWGMFKALSFHGRRHPVVRSGPVPPASDGSRTVLAVILALPRHLGPTRGLEAVAFTALMALGLCVGCSGGETLGTLIVIGDRTTVGATLLIDGRRIGTLTARDSLWQSSEQEASHRQWLAFRESLRLDERDELRLRDRPWGRETEWSRVVQDARGDVETVRLGRNWVTMQLDSVVVHEHFHGVLPPYRGSRITLISPQGESLSVGIHPYKFPDVTASFAQHRIESGSWEEGFP